MNYDVVHSGGPYGENLAAGLGNFTGLDAVKLWVDEKQDFNYKTNFCCSHYTQVVWRNSVRLGCARVGRTQGWLVVRHLQLCSPGQHRWPASILEPYLGHLSSSSYATEEY